MELTKLMIFANLTFIQKNISNIPKWIEKNWSHGGAKGKGKPIANREDWQTIAANLAAFDVRWMWNPQGNCYQDVLRKANSMALLPAER